MGYSLGGRLALHAILANPNHWQGAIIIGAHPGFANEKAKEDQRIRDAAWGKQFLEEPWNDLLSAWDALPVFHGRPNKTPRSESSFSRRRIAQCFESFSKGNQEFLPPTLAALQYPPVLYISGEEDKKYSDIGNQLSEACSIVQHEIIPDAGHRVPWENSNAFCHVIQVFLNATS